MKIFSIILFISLIPLNKVYSQYTKDTTDRKMPPDTILNDSLIINDSTKKTLNFLKKIIIQSEQKAKNKSQDANIEINGLIIDETKTKAGHDFYYKFYSSWEAPPEAKNYSIKIKEHPFRMTLTIIKIELNNKEIFKSYLQPKQNFINELSKQAIYITTQHLIYQKQIQKELINEDESGSGIY